MTEKKPEFIKRDITAIAEVKETRDKDGRLYSAFAFFEEKTLKKVVTLQPFRQLFEPLPGFHDVKNLHLVLSFQNKTLLLQRSVRFLPLRMRRNLLVKVKEWRHGCNLLRYART